MIHLVLAHAHGLHCKHNTRMTMNKFHFNEHKQDTWKCDWLIGHIISIRNLALMGQARGHGVDAGRPEAGGGIDTGRRAGEGATRRETGDGEVGEVERLEGELERER